ncbi:MAG: hypothetical protein IKL55_01560 [Clostridia bacterium]|nr:hypothetical protein [Clostridia bacterium]
MKKINETLKAKNIATGYLYFYIHLITEIVCFYFLTTIANNSRFVWLIPFIYDGMAFVPQAIIGYISDKFPKIKFSIIGMFMMFVSYVMFFGMNVNVYIALIILCLGNACVHINGAEVTLKTSNGKLSHSAIFVAGGSFGVILGKVLASTIIPFLGILILIITTIPFIMLAETYQNKNDNCENFKYANKKISPKIIIFLAVLVVMIRGYIGYGLPTSWNKTIIQTVILYFTMGLGKALGGILSDAFGIRKIAVLSTLAAIPFLYFGENIMIISLIGVMFFSMTMSITLAILVSVLKKAPGLAFGLTTIGLFLGTVPIFFVKITNPIFNFGLISVMSLVCTIILLFILDKKDERKNGIDV